MTTGQIFANNFYIAKGHASPEDARSAASYPASGSFIDVRGYERVHILIDLGAIAASDAPVFTVQSATAVNGSLSTVDATNAAHTAADDDDDEMVTMTIATDRLTDGHGFITVTASGTLVGTYAAIYYFLEGKDLAVTQASAVIPTASQYVLV